MNMPSGYNEPESLDSFLSRQEEAIASLEKENAAYKEFNDELRKKLAELKQRDLYMVHCLAAAAEKHEMEIRNKIANSLEDNGQWPAAQMVRQAKI